MRPSSPRHLWLAGVGVTLGVTAFALTADAAPTLHDYRHFRALSVDLLGRLPTRAEVAAFEKPGFDLDKWIEAALVSKGYAQRIRRTYMDLLRLDVGSTFTFRPNASVLRRQTILGPDGKQMYVYYRNGQRRVREETDGVFCLSQADIGAVFTTTGVTLGTLTKVDAKVLEANTVLVKPWWLATTPTDPSWSLIPELQKEPDGTATTMVRVCKEEASTAASAAVYATGRKAPPAGSTPPYGRLTALPLDDAYAIANKDKVISCGGGSAYSHTTACGCGPNLERCLPAAGNGVEPQAFVLPQGAMLGLDRPTSVAREGEGGWHRQWWSQEAVQMLEWLVGNDRDFREVLTGKATLVNGPLAQFYEHVAGATCCGNGINFGYVNPVGLVDPAKLPSLAPTDSATWKVVADRGPNAAGVLTLPVFLTKYGTRRGRAHVLYNAFRCRQFVAENLKLEPSTEPDLTKRSGCSTCHATLEPMSAYFARVLESDWTWLPKESFPLDNGTCKSADPLKMSGSCKSYYDPAFTNATHSLLRGSYASAAHADEGPAGLAAATVASPDFGKCVVTNVASSFLGRQLGVEDDAMVTRLEGTFVGAGYKMRALVRALVHEPAYLAANNLSSSALREGVGK